MISAHLALAMIAYQSAPTQVPKVPGLIEGHQLKAHFNASKSETRLLFLFSPS